MKIDTAEKYAGRFNRIGNKRRHKKHFSDFAATHRDDARPDHSRGHKPNHGARAVSLENAFTLKPKKTKEWFPNVGGIRIVGNYGSCDRTLVAWSEEINDPDKPWKTEYYAYAYPCTVDHGWTSSRTPWLGPVRATGKPGEHRDSLGRTW